MVAVAEEEVVLGCREELWLDVDCCFCWRFIMFILLANGCPNSSQSQESVQINMKFVIEVRGEVRKIASDPPEHSMSMW